VGAGAGVVGIGLDDVDGITTGAVLDGVGITVGLLDGEADEVAEGDGENVEDEGETDEDLTSSGCEVGSDDVPPIDVPVSWEPVVIA
jgi:hypothetical protein